MALRYELMTGADRYFPAARHVQRVPVRRVVRLAGTVGRIRMLIRSQSQPRPATRIADWERLSSRWCRPDGILKLMYLPAAITRQDQIDVAVDQVATELSPDVVRIRYDIGEDWSGQWSIFFRIVLTDEAAKRRLRDIATKVVWGLANRLDFPGMGVFPYHNFRSVSEQAKLQEEAWA